MSSPFHSAEDEKPIRSSPSYAHNFPKRPNFYPPLLYWLVALIHHSGLISFASSFNIVIALPVFLLPSLVGLLAYRVSDENHHVAMGAAFGSLFLLSDARFVSRFPPGLDYFSTFQIGLYSQPLGFVLFIGWHLVYVRCSKSRGRFALASLLLALSVLANVFSAITAALFVAATVIHDVLKLRGSSQEEARTQARFDLFAHALSAVAALCLTLFWLGPVFAQYRYFVTRPYFVPIGTLIGPALLFWYCLCIAGIVCWLRRPTGILRPYLMACFTLSIFLVLGGKIAPGWLPIQSPRMLTALNLLLCVPVGYLIAWTYSALTGLLLTWRRRLFSHGVTVQHSWNWDHVIPTLVFGSMTIALAGGALAIIKPAECSLAFFPSGRETQIDAVLRFAQGHRDGRYLVEVPLEAAVTAAFDGRALNSYLGAQGNEVLSVVFREASPHAVFFNPLINALSAFPDSFGMSSMLADDLDFAQQPVSKHLVQARMAGVRYLVIISPWIKDRLVLEREVVAKHDFGFRSVFELGNEPEERIRMLPYRPALVVSGVSLKLRRRNEQDFVRLAQEQFADGWYDVLLAHSPEVKIDHIQELDRFGALIIESYDYDNEVLAFNRLQDFAQHRPLIFLPSTSHLYTRIRSEKDKFPLAEFVEGNPGPPAEPIEAMAPSFHYGSSLIRRQWQAIRGILERSKVASSPATISLRNQLSDDLINIIPVPSPSAECLPVLIKNTYFPAWRRQDGGHIYAVTPFFMLTFVEGEGVPPSVES